MPLQKLTKAQLMGDQRSAGANIEYVRFLRGLKPGEGGETTVEEEGVSRQTIKARLNKAAGELGVGIKFHRSPANQVIFEITDGA
jgi:hypothetical protein